jgi:hypothetical protein
LRQGSLHALRLRLPRLLENVGRIPDSIGVNRKPTSKDHNEHLLRRFGGGGVWQRTRVALLAMACRGILHIPDCAAAAPCTFRKKHSTNNMV